jgi:hypothetical protein
MTLSPDLLPRAAPFGDQTRNAQNEINPKIKNYFPRYLIKNAISKNRAAQKSDQTRNTLGIDRGTT